MFRGVALGASSCVLFRAIGVERAYLLGAGPSVGLPADAQDVGRLRGTSSGARCPDEASRHARLCGGNDGLALFGGRTSLVPVCVASAVLATSAVALAHRGLRRRRGRNCHARSIARVAKDDATESVTWPSPAGVAEAVQQQWAGVLKARDDAAQTVSDTAAAVVAAPGVAAQTLEGGVARISGGIGRLQSVPSEMGRKLAQPLVGTVSAAQKTSIAFARTVDVATTGAREATNNVGPTLEATTAGASNLAKAPGQIAATAVNRVETLVSLPGRAVDSVQRGAKALSVLPERARDAVETVASIPDRAGAAVTTTAARVQMVAEGTRRTASAIVNLPGNLVSTATSAIDATTSTASAALAVPVIIASTIKSTADTVQRNVNKAQNVAKNVVEVPGNVSNGVRGTVEAAQNTTSTAFGAVAAVVEFPGKVLGIVGGAMGTVAAAAQTVGDAAGAVKSTIDGLTNATPKPPAPAGSARPDMKVQTQWAAFDAEVREKVS